MALPKMEWEAESTKKTIIVLSWFYLPFIGGAELFVKAVTERLSSRFRFVIITARANRKLPRREEKDGVRILRVGTGHWVDKFLYPIPALWSALGVRPVHLVHSIMVNAAAVTAFLYQRLTRKPSLLTLQEGDSEEYVRTWLGPFFPVYPLLHRPFDRIHAISSFLKNQAVVYGADPNTVRVVPNGVDTETFSPRAWSGEEITELRRALRLEGKRVIVSVSRLVPKNGLHDLVLAMPAIIRSHPQAVLLLVGDGEERARLETAAGELGIREQVHFAGEVTHRVISKYLQLADVFVRPSISEGLGSAFLEAMACDVPVIGTPVGGIVDFLRDGETGLFCQPRDPESITAAVCHLFGAEGLARHISANGRSLVQRDYRWDTVAERVGTIYEELLSS
jgi:glycosyltransferase involved in cell wall biosynthesis